MCLPVVGVARIVWFVSHLTTVLYIAQARDQQRHDLCGLCTRGELAGKRDCPENAVDTPDASGGQNGSHFVHDIGYVHARLVFEQQFYGVDITGFGRLVQRCRAGTQHA